MKILFSALIVLIPVGLLRADDVVLKDGSVFRNVRVIDTLDANLRCITSASVTYQLIPLSSVAKVIMRTFDRTVPSHFEDATATNKAIIKASNIKYKSQWLMFPAILSGVAAVLYFKDANEQRHLSRELGERASHSSQSGYGSTFNPGFSNVYLEQSRGAAASAERKTLYGAGFTIVTVLCTYYAFQPTYIFPDETVKLTPTQNGLTLSYKL